MESCLACSLALSPLFLGKRSSLTLIYLRGYLRFAAAISCFFNLKRSGCAAVKKALIKSSDTHTHKSLARTLTPEKKN